MLLGFVPLASRAPSRLPPETLVLPKLPCLRSTRTLTSTTNVSKITLPSFVPGTFLTFSHLSLCLVTLDFCPHSILLPVATSFRLSTTFYRYLVYSFIDTDTFRTSLFAVSTDLSPFPRRFFTVISTTLTMPISVLELPTSNSDLM